MAEVTAEAVKNLRERTGAGMLDCKKALVENGGDMDASIDWLRKKGLSSAAKKAGRVAAEGLIAAVTKGTKGALIELNAETDFVARNADFQQLAQNIAGVAITLGGDLDALKKATLSGKTVDESIAEAIGVIGENMNLRRYKTLEVKSGVIASYVHAAAAPGLGKIGVLVALESAGDAEKLNALGKQIAMHVAAAKPEALTTAELDPASIEREKNIFREQAASSGKPAEIIEKMIEGRLRKFYEEVVLLEQVSVMDGKTKVSETVKQAEKEIGAPIKVTGYVRFGLGEGVEKQETDFAAEVAAAAKAS